MTYRYRLRFGAKCTVIIYCTRQTLHSPTLILVWFQVSSPRVLQPLRFRGNGGEYQRSAGSCRRYEGAADAGLCHRRRRRRVLGLGHGGQLSHGARGGGGGGVAQNW